MQNILIKRNEPGRERKMLHVLIHVHLRRLISWKKGVKSQSLETGNDREDGRSGEIM